MDIVDLHVGEPGGGCAGDGVGHHAATGPSADLDKGIAGTWDIFELPVKELAVEGL